MIILNPAAAKTGAAPIDNRITVLMVSGDSCSVSAGTGKPFDSLTDDARKEDAMQLSAGHGAGSMG